MKTLTADRRMIKIAMEAPYLERDEEHNAWLLKIDDRSTGYSRVDMIGPEFVTSGEFRTLASHYAEIAGVLRSLRKAPLEVHTVTNGKSVQEDTDAADGAEDSGLTADERDALTGRDREREPIHRQHGLGPRTHEIEEARRGASASCATNSERFGELVQLDC